MSAHDLLLNKGQIKYIYLDFRQTIYFMLYEYQAKGEEGCQALTRDAANRAKP